MQSFLTVHAKRQHRFLQLNTNDDHGTLNNLLLTFYGILLVNSELFLSL